MKQYTFFMLSLLICLVAIGCGKNYRLTGKVTFDDGEPATNGTVILQTGNFVARGEIKPDGSYIVSSEGTNDGLPSGEYKVSVQGIFRAPPPAAPGQMMPPLPVLVCDPKYTDPETSGLTCKVPAPGNKFDIVLERRKD